MHKKVLLAILDGYGISNAIYGNAVQNANTPMLDELINSYPCVLLDASGEAVGLPMGQIGNSEVGHLNIGAGRVVYTGLSLINQHIKDRSFFANKAFLKTIEHVEKNHSKIHLIGLFSNGGVHSHNEHLLALIELFSKHAKVVLHLFGDGRDVAPCSLKQDLEKLMIFLKNYPNVVIGTIGGRYYGMDRDERWDREMIAYKALLGVSKNKFNDPIGYIETQYQNQITDEFIYPAINANLNSDQFALNNNDGVIFFNFRPDRARQMSHLIFNSNYYNYQPELKRKENLFFVTMMNYEGIVPSEFAFPPQTIKNSLGEVIANNNLKQLRIAETEKYAHVTFFFDGGFEVNLSNETKTLIPSLKVATYDLAPEMSCKAITDALLEKLNNFDFTVLNFANPDMVGHTGNYQACIKALEALDVQIKRIVDFCKANQITMFLTADHGNAEVMIDNNNNPVTKHTINPVPFVCTDKNVNFNQTGILANIAPTILEYLNLSKPKEMTAKSLLKNNN